MAFPQAVERYLEERSLTVIPATVGQEKTHFRTLGDSLGAKRLNQITGDDIRQYQAHRLAKGRHPNTINHEVKALLRLLKRAKLASRLRDDVRLLPARREPRQMLTPAEKQRIFDTAASKPEWETAFAAASSPPIPACGRLNSGACAGETLIHSHG